MAYTRVNWEDGEKTADGYVTVDGTNYTTVEPVYEGNTPLNSQNLNIMDKGIKDLDSYVEEMSSYSTDEKLIGKDDGGNPVFRKKFEFQVSSINKDSSFDMNIPNVDKFQKLETYYSVNNAFVPLPFSSGTGATLSSRIEIPSTSTNRVKLYGTASYGDAGTFKITVIYTKKSN